MARVQGLKEKLHMPLYDAFVVPDKVKVYDVMQARDPRALRFFVDTQNKTRLDTNLQAAGELPSRNSYEARAMRIVVGLLGDRDEGYQVLFLRELIYSSVTSLLVGEKEAIVAPSFYFPSGAGVAAGGANHGEPDPMATFRFAEAVTIEPNQAFRVEMLFPTTIPKSVQDAPGPLRIWVVLDGYLTRDVQ